MKLELELEDIQAIASAVLETLKPALKEIRSKEPDEIMDVKSLAEYLNVKTTWVYKQIEFKSIPHFHAGKYPRFRRKEIDTWINENSTPAVASPYPKLKAA